MRRAFIFLLVPVLVSTFAVCGFAADKSATPELRALWVDGFNPGIRTPEEANNLIAAAKRGGFNTLIVQVRRRGDALYLKSIEPYVEEVAHIPGFDPLANIVELAHRNGLEVHAWINAAPVWRDAPPPKDPNHVFNLHGPTATGDDMWLTSNRAGNVKFPVGYFLDMGNPAAADYIFRVYLNVVRNYDVDGIHYDYIRYPETDGQQLPRGADVGYNPTSLARFRRATGRTDTPEPGDQQWIEWRRQQVTQLVRRVYLEAKAIKPKLKISGAVIAWGRPPANEKDFENVAPMQRIFQNWHGWLQDGFLDVAVPMNYAAESRPQIRDWFNGWISFEKRHQHGRQIAPGIGAYQNTQEEVLAQIARVRQAAPGGSHAPGMSLYSYGGIFRLQPMAAAGTAAGTAPAAPVAAVAGNGGKDLQALRSDPIERTAFLGAGPFAAAAAIPALKWVESPTRGGISGTLKKTDGSGVDGGMVRVRKASWFASTHRVVADGNGNFGIANLKPGSYRVQSGENGKAMKVSVAAGGVAKAEVVF
jgi:uncharacterized lipoprotein YddW (UPF0748 family)